MTYSAEAIGRPVRTDLSVVVPVYRGAECLDALVEAIGEAMGQTGLRYEVVLVNDGSPDRSWDVISKLCSTRPEVIGVDLRRNFGQDNAILAGLRYARGRAVAIMDDDLQHDPRALPALLAKLEEGADAVYADFHVRHHAAWKRLGSWFNGKVAEWVLDKPPGVYLSPYKVIRKGVADLICAYEGPYPYVDGLLLQVTGRITQIPVVHHPRFAGHSAYTFRKSIRVWTRLATSFSVRPLRVVTWTGLAAAAVGTVLAAWVIAYRILDPQAFSAEAVGWASLMVSLLLISGVQMIFFGVIGEYLGRTYLTVARQPQSAVRIALNARRKRRRQSSEVRSHRREHEGER